MKTRIDKVEKTTNELEPPLIIDGVPVSEYISQMTKDELVSIVDALDDKDIDVVELYRSIIKKYK